MLATFYFQEDEYTDWIRRNPSGFVFNHFKSKDSNMNVVHQARCNHLHRSKDFGSRTTVEKICSNNLDKLLDEVIYIRGHSWKFCGSCCSSLTRVRQSRPIISEVKPDTSFIKLDQSQTAVLEDICNNRIELFVSGEPAVWVGSGEAQWKETIRRVISQEPPTMSPKWIDMEFRVLHHKLLLKDLDNVITPVLDVLRNIAVLNRGFQNLKSITATKRPVYDEHEQGVNIALWHEPIGDTIRFANDITIVCEDFKPNDKAIKGALYEASANWWRQQKDLSSMGLYPVYLAFEIELQSLRSIRDLLKPCIDGLEPILGRTDNLPPVFGLKRLFHKFSPRDNTVFALCFNLRQGSLNRITASISRGPSPL